MSTPDDLVAFLAARLDEVEAAAREADNGTPWHATAEQFGPRLTTGPGGNDYWDREVSYAVWVCDDEADGCPDANRAAMAEGRHIALHDPDRELRAVAAKRRIVKRYERESGSGLPGRGVALDILIGPLRDLAAIWDGHPDYRQEWAP